MNRKFLLLSSLILISYVIQVNNKGLNYFSLNLSKQVFPPSRQLKVYNIDFDLPVFKRYEEVLNDFKDVAKELAEKIFDEYVGNLQYILRPLLYFRAEDPEELKELTYFSEFLDVPLYKLKLMNLANDFNYMNSGHPIDDGDVNKARGCTSIIGVDNETGNIIFGRGLDQGPASLSQLQYHAHIYKGGKLIIKTTLMAGSAAFNLGMRMGEYSISLNSRHRTDYIELFTSLYNMINGANTSPSLIRKTLFNASTYQEAVDYVSKAKIIGGSFYNIGGLEIGQGAIIAKYAGEVSNIDFLQNKNYILQTNYDSWNPDPVQQHDPRRHAAIDFLKDKKINEDTIMGALKDPKVTVKVTILQCIMSPKLDIYKCDSQ